MIGTRFDLYLLFVCGTWYDLYLCFVCGVFLTFLSLFRSMLFCLSTNVVGELVEGARGPAEQQDPAVSRVRRSRKATPCARVYVREGTGGGPQCVSALKGVEEERGTEGGRGVEWNGFSRGALLAIV